MRTVMKNKVFTRLMTALLLAVTVILDLDTGIDDALALAYALAHPDLELIGVTVTYGNVPVERKVRLMLLIF